MVTKKELAEMLKVHINTIDRYMKLGMPVIKKSGAVRFELDAVMEWLRKD
jgi:phage terminase Nu1 subunit (DNA packaging protein)